MNKGHQNTLEEIRHELKDLSIRVDNIENRLIKEDEDKIKQLKAEINLLKFQGNL